MSFNISFATFTKRTNSTKRPTSYDITLSGDLLDDCDITHPSIRIYRGHVSNAHLAYNYCYIQEFNRYYWIDSWEWANPNWVMHCSCDVLATYKTEIGASTHYVVRSASLYNLDIQDTLYPAWPWKYTLRNYVNSPWAVNATGKVDYTSGVYVVGVVSTAAKFGTVEYYAISYSNMSIFTASLMACISNNVNGFDADDASIALQRSLVDPMQFIKSCTYIPVDWAYALSNGWLAGEALQSMTVFDWTVSVPCRRLSVMNAVIILSFGELPEHPQANRGTWLNAPPYMNYTAWIPPFGEIELDGSLLAYYRTLYASINIDLITGHGFVYFYNNNDRKFSKVNSQIGIPIQLSQITRDYVGATTAAIGGIASLFTGNFLGAAAAVGNGVNSAKPHVSTIGSNGGFSDFNGGNPTIYCDYYLIGSEDLTEHGRPLCQLSQISALSGYILCENAEMTISGTSEESDMVTAYLNGGFFYE